MLPLEDIPKQFRHLKGEMQKSWETKPIKGEKILLEVP